MAKEPKMSDDGNDSPASEPHYKLLQNAHDKYFREIADAGGRVQTRLQTIQKEFERSAERAVLNQEPEGFRTAQDQYQREMEAAANDTSAFDGYADAYRSYKEAIRDMFASADLDDMTFTDMAYLSQSLYAVAQTAANLSCSAPSAANNNPFNAQ